MYSSELSWNQANTNNEHCSFLDLDIHILNGKINTQVYDKRERLIFISILGLYSNNTLNMTDCGHRTTIKKYIRKTCKICKDLLTKKEQYKESGSYKHMLRICSSNKKEALQICSSTNFRFRSVDWVVLAICSIVHAYSGHERILIRLMQWIVSERYVTRDAGQGTPT